jgi:hypothetical protein
MRKLLFTRNFQQREQAMNLKRVQTYPGECDGNGGIGKEMIVSNSCKLLLLHLDGVQHLPDFNSCQNDSGIVLTRDAVAVAADGTHLTCTTLELSRKKWHRKAFSTLTKKLSREG